MGFFFINFIRLIQFRLLNLLFPWSIYLDFDCFKFSNVTIDL